MTNSALGRLLIVDDEPNLTKALCDTLRDQGYDCVGFTSAREALRVFPSQKFDLLLSDLSMPEMDGIALLQAALDIDPYLVGIIMTGQGTIATAVEAMQTGALDYILKPFKVGEILPVLARALAVRRLRLENASLQQSIRERTAELEYANTELDAFCYSVSHDLRAPLRAQLGFAGILLEDFGRQLEPEAQELLRRISTSASRMGQLIDDLLYLSRLGRQSLKVEPVATSSMVQEVLQDFQEEIADRDIEVHVDALPDCEGDSSLLRQVFMNLLSNAFKFTGPKDNAVIHVGFLRKQGQTVYFVRDNGVGFDMNLAGGLFDAFQRLHSAGEFQGHGVGLSIVQRIVRRHGGRIWAEAGVNSGATFFFTLQSPVPNAALERDSDSSALITQGS